MSLFFSFTFLKNQNILLILEKFKNFDYYIKWKIILFLFLLINNLNARELEITVIDKDIEIPLEGVRISLQNSTNFFYTDENGFAKITIDDNLSQAVLILYLIGYDTKRVVVKNTDKKLTIGMNIQGVIEGKELVIEQKIIQKKR